MIHRAYYGLVVTRYAGDTVVNIIINCKLMGYNLKGEVDIVRREMAPNFQSYPANQGVDP